MADEFVEGPSIELEPDPTTQILVVDDDPSIRTLNSRIFMGQDNTHVEVASSGQEGLEKYKQSGGDLVVSDRTMPPGIFGEEMLFEIIKLNPDVFTVLASGDVDLEDRKESMLAGGINVVLQKPINVQQLLDVLDQAREWKSEREKFKSENTA